MNKSITIISLNYAPEDTAIGFYSTQMAEFLYLKGWNVTVITGFPYYPQWEIHKSYQNKATYLKESINGVNILRYKQFVPSDPKILNRILQITDFTIGSIHNINKIKFADIVLSIIPFTGSAWLGKKLSSKIKAKHWVHVQDFEFDIAFDAGIISNKRLNKFIAKKVLKIESKILNSADIVSSISHGMVDKLKNKCSTNTYYFPNWIDDKKINPSVAQQHPYLKSNKFKVLYSGNLGEKQDWKLFINIVQYFKNNKKIEFIIVGDGSFKKDLVEQTKDFKNIRHYNPVPFYELNNLLCSADLHLLLQKDDVVNSVMPSKILGMLASEVPCLITGNLNSEIARIIFKESMGYFFKSTDLQIILKTIENIISEKNFRKSAGKKARNYVINSFAKDQILNNFNSKLIAILDES